MAKDANVATVAWEGDADRRRHIAGLTRKEIKRHPSPSARSLEEAYEGRRSISLRDLSELAHAHEVPVVSLYLTAAPDPPAPQTPLLTAFHSLRHNEIGARRRELDHIDKYAATRLERNLDEIEAFLRDLTPDRMRSLVVFKAGDELNRVITLPQRVRNRLVVDMDPYILPLEIALTAHETALVVLVEKDGAHLWTHHLGHEEDVGDVRSFVPSDMVDRSRPGKGQRHRLTHLQWHLRSVEREVVALFGEHDCDVLILAGDEGVVAEFRDLLGKEWQARVVGTLPLVPGETAAQRAARVEAVLDRRRETVEISVLDELPQLKAYGLLVSGLADVLDAANRFLVRRLIVSDTLEARGFVCPEHHFLSLDGSACPFDSTALLPVENVVDELVELSHLFGVQLLLVERRDDLMRPYDGIAGVLYPPA